MTPMERNRGGRPRHPDILTPAEWRVLEALREGGTNAEIGARLGISADAVKYHVSNMLGKLALRDRRELASWRPGEEPGRQRGLVAIPAAIAYLARPVVWVGMGMAAVAGATALAVAAVALVAIALVGVPGSADEPTPVRPPAVAATPTPPAAAVVTPTPTATTTATPTATPAATPAPTAPPTATPTATATPPPIATPAPTPALDPGSTTVRYNRLDTTGAAATAGSYAFLTTAGDTSSAIYNFGYLPQDGVELRVHPADASGTSRAAFYDTVRVGDSFDYRTNGPDCAFRFKVTSVAAAATPRVFGIEYLRGYGGWCEDFVDDPGAATDVEFVWGVRPGIPGPDGVRALLRGEPAGEGTYRLYEGVPYVLDVPAGMRVIQNGMYYRDYYHLPPPPNAPRAHVTLTDADTRSVLLIDPDTGREIERRTTSLDVDALFDQIVASIRRVE